MTGSGYSRTQVGFVTIGAVSIIGGIVAAVTFANGKPSVGAVVCAVCTFIITCFGWLRIQVTDESIRLRFGVGLIRRSIALADVQSCAAVRNSWWYGWGIRLTPHGWMWNVAGLDAVELTRPGGGKFRIGTDDVDGLRRAIDARLGA